MKNTISSAIRKTIIEHLNETDFVDLLTLVLVCKKHITPEYAYSKYHHHSNAKNRDYDIIISEGYYYAVIAVLCQLTKSGVVVKEGVGRNAVYKLKGQSND